MVKNYKTIKVKITKFKTLNPKKPKKCPFFRNVILIHIILLLKCHLGLENLQAEYIETAY